MRKYFLICRPLAIFYIPLMKERILALQSNDDASFNALALEVFHYQYKNNAFYRSYCTLIKKLPDDVKKISDIPFLPITFFKNHPIKTGDWTAETVFTSSGTTGMTTSSHHVHDISFYNKITQIGFEKFYGKIEDYCILGLLPAYLERSGSSLVAMTDYFIRQSRYAQSGFFLYDHDALREILLDNQEKKIPTLLIGVTFALLDFSQFVSLSICQLVQDQPTNRLTDQPTNLIIMETGGMKGRRKEMIREELHTILKKGFGVSQIHSEYGMTELLSQGYSKGNGIFAPIPSMRVLLREVTDPFSIFDLYDKIQSPKSKNGVINIIDLANIDTCSFIATDDLGKLYPDGTFEVLGRLDMADIRGCSLMVD